MRRRIIIAVVGAVMAWPFGARAQVPAMPVIGFLNSASPGPFAPLLAAFLQGLKEGGFVDGQNVTIEYRWAEGQYERLPALANELVGRHVSVIAATGGTVSARAAKAATSTIPVLFIGGANPVGEGLVASFARPGGNVTGVSTYTSELVLKRLQLLRELVPKASKIATLTNPENVADVELQDMQRATGMAGLALLPTKAKAASEFELAFAQAAEQRAEALFVSADPFFTSQRAQLIALAARHSLPTAYPWREYAQEGGLMSYGTSLAGTYHQIGQYVARVLKGDKPADLPVQNPKTFELVINLKTAKTLGLTVPPIAIARANEVIE